LLLHIAAADYCFCCCYLLLLLLMIFARFFNSWLRVLYSDTSYDTFNEWSLSGQAIIDWSMVLNSWLRDRSTDTLDDYRNIISMSGHSVVNWLSIRQGFWIPSSDIFISTSIPYTTIITYFRRVVTRWSSDYRLVKGFEFLVTIPFYIYLTWIS
jgi:hypothetical protein